MNYEELLNKVIKIFIDNKDELPIEDAGTMNITFTTQTPIMDGTLETCNLNVMFVQYVDLSFNIEGASLLTTQLDENDRVLKSEFKEIEI